MILLLLCVFIALPLFLVSLVIAWKLAVLAFQLIWFFVALGRLAWPEVRSAHSHRARVLDNRADALTALLAALDGAVGEREELARKLGQNDRIGTHSPQCHTFGPRHYECAMGKLAVAEAMLEDARGVVRPFAEACRDADDEKFSGSVEAWESPMSMAVTYRDFRRARAFLNSLASSEEG